MVDCKYKHFTCEGIASDQNKHGVWMCKTCLKEWSSKNKQPNKKGY